MDFLLCIAAILETKIQEHLRRPPERLEATSKLDLHPEVKIIGEHPSMTTLLEYIRLVAPTEATVLITVFALARNSYLSIVERFLQT